MGSGVGVCMFVNNRLTRFSLLHVPRFRASLALYTYCASEVTKRLSQVGV